MSKSGQARLAFTAASKMDMELRLRVGSKPNSKEDVSLRLCLRSTCGLMAGSGNIGDPTMSNIVWSRSSEAAIASGERPSIAPRAIIIKKAQLSFENRVFVLCWNKGIKIVVLT